MKKTLIALAALALSANGALAHATLETGEAH